MNVFIDIETVPTQPELETKAEIAKSIKHPAAMKKAETIQAWHEGEDKHSLMRLRLLMQRLSD